jgi:hypothetical protein
VVGNKLLKEIGVKPGSPEAYAFTYNNFEDLAAKYDYHNHQSNLLPNQRPIP